MEEVKTRGTPAARIMALFEGFSDAYGTYDQNRNSETRGGKLEIKSSARTIRSPVTRELWERHLAGELPLGIIPIRDNDTCLWGVIDIDVYALDHSALYEKLEKENLPMVMCRSKSGGAHLFMFFSEPIEARLVIMRLREIAVLLGYGSAEVFPKQSTVQVDRGDLGNWLNMPYFDGDKTSRYGIKKGGLAMSVAEFLHFAEGRRVAESFMLAERRKKPENDPEFGDGPPCMQHLVATGFPEGVRNKGLFALGVLAKKKYPDTWADVLEDWNRKYFDPPLPSSEVSDIIRSLQKKDYYYSCKEQPLVAHCNSHLCKTRRYGVGGAGEFPVISGMSVLDTDPPLWFIDVDDIRVELTTDELLNYPSFHKVCMERMLKCYPRVKQETWLNIVASAVESVIRIDAPPEVSRLGHFTELVEQFLTDKHRATNREEILLGKPYEDVEEERFYFRLRDLQKFLEDNNFKIFSRGQVTTRLKTMGGGTHFFNLKGQGVNTFYLPSSAVQRPGQVDLPKIERDPI